MFQVTLRVARELNGYTKEETAQYCGVSTNTINELENNSGQVAYELLLMILKLYSVSPELIYFGSEAECIKHNRMLSQF